MAEQAFIQAYKDELKQLTGPDKARINTLSMLAEDNKEHAQAVVTVIEKHLHEVCWLLGRGGVILGAFCLAPTAAAATSSAGTDWLTNGVHQPHVSYFLAVRAQGAPPCALLDGQHRQERQGALQDTVLQTPGACEYCKWLSL